VWTNSRLSRQSCKTNKRWVKKHSSSGSSDSDLTVGSNYNSKKIYLSKDTDIDKSAKTKKTHQWITRCTDHVVNPKTISSLLHAKRWWRAKKSEQQRLLDLSKKGNKESTKTILESAIWFWIWCWHSVHKKILKTHSLIFISDFIHLRVHHLEVEDQQWYFWDHQIGSMLVTSGLASQK